MQLLNTYYNVQIWLYPSKDEKVPKLNTCTQCTCQVRNCHKLHNTYVNPGRVGYIFD